MRQQKSRWEHTSHLHSSIAAHIHAQLLFVPQQQLNIELSVYLIFYRVACCHRVPQPLPPPLPLLLPPPSFNFIRLWQFLWCIFYVSFLTRVLFFLPPNAMSYKQNTFKNAIKFDMQDISEIRRSVWFELNTTQAMMCMYRAVVACAYVCGRIQHAQAGITICMKQ